jgi:hypothetical protein
LVAVENKFKAAVTEKIKCTDAWFCAAAALQLTTEALCSWGIDLLSARY